MVLNHLRYLWYLVRHKWFVFVGCYRLGIPLRGVLHDLSKFSFVEWFPYVERFYGGKASSDGAPVIGGTVVIGDAFDFAWLHHIHLNPHHWQWWVLDGYSGFPKVLPMSLKFVKEMVADWWGVSRALGKSDVQGWYEVNKDKMILHPHTRILVEKLLERFDVRRG